MLNKPPKALSSLPSQPDDVEPDRYSMNLERINSKLWAERFPVASVKTDGLEIDRNFVRKYEGVLISKEEIEIITRCLGLQTIVTWTW